MAAKDGYVDVPKIRLLYPDSRMVAEATVFGWAKDAYLSGDSEVDPQTLLEAIAILEDLGFITVAKKRGDNGC